MSKLLIIGIGPGDASSLTEKARAALAEADLICGYNLYVDLDGVWVEFAKQIAD